ncbi:MAG: NAD(P)-binding protein [Rhodospirillaceae bacterium]|nr:NAD(P)-binding protein [Rhodospirillaceae bacterium]MBT5244314.1 NAD(P)-binding protein [Rhodospirillaceae bacterium]MBT5563675.1 NAD(P)-binding protein [Rhodospirillaceae bacterium]MBT6241505.1 NAD(P)-binding protein [Rhodospirillaceae bacterium]MBT7137079.1 NAD(P)-binding protein [Rhodospirillaceae bacterium]
MPNNRITRRDFLNGTLIGAGTALIGERYLFGTAHAREAEALWPGADAPYYPPAWTGMRGSHPGSYERAHEFAREGREDWGEITETGEEYDLVVVGGGASGLAAAYFFQDAHDWEEKVLILDNHDDFGGHAKRNEFESGGQMRMTYGGSQGFDNIDNWPDEMWDLLEDLGIDLEKFENEHYDYDWFERHGLGGAVFMDAKTWGKDHVIPADLGGMAPVMPGLEEGPKDYEALFAKAPMPEKARKELTKLYEEDGARKIINKIDELDFNFDRYPYEKFLQKYWYIKEQATFDFIRKLPTDENGVGAETLSLSEGIEAELPGTIKLGRFYRMTKKPDPEDAGYVHHFPDGNAGFCRTIVRAMIPDVAPGEGADSVVLAKFDYEALDDPENETRIRLNSTVISAKHDGPVDDADTVSVTYIRDGKAYRVKAKGVVMACWNMIIPHLIPELPEDQKEALASNVKIPYVFANVMIKNWQAIKKSGIGAAYCPTSYYHLLQTEYPINMGGYSATEDPNDPMPVTLIRVPVPEERGMEPRDQFREGRSEIISLEFADFEAEVNAQLDGMFGPYGFQSKRDIEAITLNRWSHGYSYTYFNLFDKGMSFDDGPHIKAREPFGLITIANSDSGANSWLDVGVMQGLRAVNELLEDD